MKYNGVMTFLNCSWFEMNQYQQLLVIYYDFQTNRAKGTRLSLQ